jgi:hypothetical protein
MRGAPLPMEGGSDAQNRPGKPPMPTVAYTSLIRVLRSLDEELYTHESEVLRGAADACLLGDDDRTARLDEADELLGWLEESDRVAAERLEALRAQFRALNVTSSRTAAGRPTRRQSARRSRGVLGILRDVLGLPADGSPLPLPPSALPGVPTLPAVSVGAAATPVAPEMPAVEAGEAARLFEGAESLLRFEAWLDENQRR